MLSSTLATAKACAELPRHRTVMGYEVDVDCIAACTEAPVEMYARQVLNEKSNTPASDEVLDAWKIVVRALDWLQVTKQMKSWNVPACYYAIKMILFYIFSFF